LALFFRCGAVLGLSLLGRHRRLLVNGKVHGIDIPSRGQFVAIATCWCPNKEISALSLFQGLNEDFVFPALDFECGASSCGHRNGFRQLDNRQVVKCCLNAQDALPAGWAGFDFLGQEYPADAAHDQEAHHY
jgi:hypothetical protein